MDEPTNHLDMVSKDILKNALNNYDGTLIIVSHDRDFLQGLSEKVYEFKDKGIKEYLGDINEFLNAKKVMDFKQFELENKQKHPLQNLRVRKIKSAIKNVSNWIKTSRKHPIK